MFEFDPARYRRPRLTPREIQVVRFWLVLPNKEQVARHLYLAPSTVNTYVCRTRSAYAEVGRVAPTKAHLLARFLQDGHCDIDHMDLPVDRLFQ